MAFLKHLLSFILILLLFSCSYSREYARCVDVVYLQSDSENRFTERYYFKCDLYPSSRIAIDCVQVFVPHYCPIPSFVGTGHYTVHILTCKGGRYLLHGDGSGDRIIVRSNKILDSDLMPLWRKHGN